MLDEQKEINAQLIENSREQLEWVEKMKAQRCMSIVPRNFKEIAGEAIHKTETGIRVVVPIEGHETEEYEEEDEISDESREVSYLVKAH